MGYGTNLQLYRSSDAFDGVSAVTDLLQPTANPGIVSLEPTQSWSAVGFISGTRLRHSQTLSPAPGVVQAGATEPGSFIKTYYC